MKKLTMKQSIINILFLLFACSVIICACNLVKHNDTIKTANAEVGSFSDTYLESGGYSFSYECGTVNDLLIAYYDGNQLDLKTYDWYYIEKENIYIANVLSGIGDYIASIIVFPAYHMHFWGNEGTVFNHNFYQSNTLEIISIDEELENACKTLSILSDNQFNNIINYAEKLELGDDVLSQIIQESISFEFDFKSQMFDGQYVQQLNSIQLNSLTDDYANENETVYLGDYSLLTDYDGYLKDYQSKYMGKSGDVLSAGVKYPLNDDAIVTIIPKKLFQMRGKYSYIGYEYGFYINTFQKSGNDNSSEFIVFDIDYVYPYPGWIEDSAPSITIYPIFSGTSTYYYESKKIFVDIIPTDLALGNIKLNVGLKNVDQLNIGDIGYNANNDYGYAFSSYTMEVNGVGIKRESDNIDLSFLKYSLKLLNKIPNVGNSINKIGGAIVNTLEWVADYYTANQSVQYSQFEKTGDNSYFTEKTIVQNNNVNSMILNYGNLIKGLEFELLDQGKLHETDYPLLYKSAEHKFIATYSFCQRDADINWEAQVCGELNIDIFKDTTGKILGFIKTGELTKQDSVRGMFYTFYNEIPINNIITTIEEGVPYLARYYGSETGKGAYYQEFYFTPSRTYKYVIETFNSYGGKTKINLFLPDGTDLNVYNSYKDNGNNKVELTLQKNIQYKIRIKNASDKNSGQCKFIIRKNASVSEPYGSNLKGVTVQIENDNAWYEFRPLTTGYYAFYTPDMSTAIIELYDESYNRIMYDQRSVNIYVHGSQIYYIKISLIRNGTETFHLFVNKQGNLYVNPITKNASLGYEYSSTQTMVLYFVPQVAGTYTFYTVKMTGDPCLSVNNFDMSILATDDNSAGDNNAKITMELKANKRYYIVVRNSSRTGEGMGTLYISYS